ncbi:MAG: four helix bundle protein [Ignavibacteriae bacterium]|nr:MAG: four helix bundle protein [Ignavibacteriota bacterium]
MKIDRFEEIESWKGARDLTSEIYRMTKKDGFVRDFGLKDQIQRASVSIMANIAEGFDSGSKRNFILFLNYAYRSASEVQSLLYVTLDCNYITQNEFEFAYKKATDIKNLIGGFIKYLRK